MAWLLLGAALLLLAVPGGRGKARPVDALGLAAIAAFAVTAWLALPVYSLARIAPIALVWSAAASLALLFAPRTAPQGLRWTGLALGAASSLFALFGPADGLL